MQHRSWRLEAATARPWAALPMLLAAMAVVSCNAPRDEDTRVDAGVDGPGGGPSGVDRGPPGEADARSDAPATPPATEAGVPGPDGGPTTPPDAPAGGPADATGAEAAAAPPPPTCPSATPDACPGTCVNLKTDPRSCGRCGYACDSFQACAAGVCSPRYESTRVTPAIPATIWDVAVAADGAVYVAGTFKGTVDFDPGPAVENLTAMGTNGDAFVSRFDARDAYQWTRTLPSATGVNFVHATATTDGAVVLSGYYQGTMDFLSARGGASRTARTMNADEGYLIKIRADGQVGFVRTFPATYSSVFHAEALADGALAAVGPFLGPVDFGSGPPLDGVAGGYLARVSPSGETTWVRTFTGAVPNVVSESVSASLVAAGGYSGDIDLNPGPGTAAFNSGQGKALFVVKLDGGGQYQTGGSVGLAARDVVPADVRADASAFYVAGRLADAMLPTGPAASPRPRATAGDNDAFVSKLGLDGSYQWGRLYGGPAYDYAQRLALLPGGGGVLVAGAFFSPMVDLGSEGAPDVRAASAGRLFVTGLRADGSYRGSFTLAATPIAMRATDTTLGLAGSFSGLTDFNPRADEKDERGSTVGAAFFSTYRF